MEDDNVTITDDTPSFQSLHVAPLLVVEIPAIPCILLILFYLFSHCQTMVIKVLRNHPILLLTIISFLYITLDLPFTINSYRLGCDSPRSPAFCRWWYWIDYTIISISLLMTATASIQRHILIFNAHYFHQKRIRILFHYVPLMTCLLYPPIFYLILIYFYPCENSIDEYEQYCPNPCYSENSVLFYIDWMVNTLMPVGVIAAANILLVYRVVHLSKRFHRRGSLMWKRQRKMTLELLIISSVYMFGWGPSIVVAIIQQFFLPGLMETSPWVDYLNYMSYFVCPLQPFIFVGIMPELWKFIKNSMRKCLVRSAVNPQVNIIRLH
jgi:hypothetical protein